MTYEKPTHLDLFSGIGGFSLAFEREGFRTVGFSEVDPYASAVLKKHWPDVPNYGDIRNIKSIKADVITGGFPCQPFSVAGKQRGKEDDRYLWPEMLRVIKEVRPSFVVGENVAGIVNMELDNCLSDLESIGYASIPFIIPACSVGAPHRRDRVWIVAHADKERESRFPKRTGAQHASLGISRENEDVANAVRGRQSGSRQSVDLERPATASHRKATKSIDGRRPAQWEIEPAVGRVVDGLPNRSHRLKCLGNAIVPQVAQVIAKAIFERMNEN